MQNPYDVLAANAKRTPDRIALKLPASSVSYAAFVNIVDGFAEVLVRSGFQPGFKVVVMVKPGLELYALAFALFKVKGIPVIVDPGMGLKRILASYQHVGAEVFIGIPITQIIRTFATETFSSLQLIYSVKNGVLKVVQGQEQALSHYPLPAAIQKNELGFITFTTGSTGPAKAVEASYGMLEAAVHIIRTQFDQGPDEKDLVSMPFFGLISLMIGSTVVIPKMNPGKPAHINAAIIAKTILDEGITSMLASPAFYDKLSRFASDHKLVFPTLRCMTAGGAPMTLDIMKRCETMISAQGKFYVCWGATEGLPLSFINVKEVESLKIPVIAGGLGAPIGRPVSGVRLEIIRLHKGDAPAWNERDPLPQGELGEIIANGANVSTGYYKDDKANRAHKLIDSQGQIWHRTGDVGFLDAEGRVIFTGRMAHIVEFEGEIFHSVACEGVSNAHAQVKRSALVSAFNKPTMILELRPDASNAHQIKDEVRSLLQANPRTAKIKDILIHRSFPVDPRHNAKIERAKLALWACYTPSLSSHLPKIIPIGGWLFLLAPLFFELNTFWWVIWWIDLILSTVAHLAQIPTAIPIAEIHGYSKKETAFWTMVLGATFWKPLTLTPKA